MDFDMENSELIDKLRQELRLRKYSSRTEKSYVYVVEKFFPFLVGAWTGAIYKRKNFVGYGPSAVLKKISPYPDGYGEIGNA